MGQSDNRKQKGKGKTEHKTERKSKSPIKNIGEAVTNEGIETKTYRKHVFSDPNNSICRSIEMNFG